jgi:hypothetical protein
MNRFAAIFLLAGTASACTAMQGSPTADAITYGCEDTVVLGRLETLGSEPTMHIEGDMLGHGWFTANLAVERRLAGPVALERLQVRYFAHSAYRDDRRFLIVFGLLNHDSADYVILARPTMIERQRLTLLRQCDR